MSESSPWADLLESQGPRLVLYARRWAINHAEAEDLVQEGLVRCWQSASEVDDPLAYLYQAVRSVAIDAARRRASRQTREQLAARPQHDSHQLTCPLEQEERRNQIEAALKRLPVEQAEVVTLKIWSELTFAQIAKITAMAPGTVASRYRYALEHLRSMLAEEKTR